MDWPSIVGRVVTDRWPAQPAVDGIVRVWRRDNGDEIRCPIGYDRFGAMYAADWFGERRLLCAGVFSTWQRAADALDRRRAAVTP